jgi:hypothetical protein
MVFGTSDGIRWPARNPSEQSFAPLGSAPKTLTPVPSAASAMPANRPPPPTGAMTAASGVSNPASPNSRLTTSGACCSSSRNTVPCPSMVRTESYG